MCCFLLNFKIYVKANANYLPYSAIFLVIVEFILSYNLIININIIEIAISY